ncbi:Bromodomain-containing protein 8 [Trametes pubescens]|uniref:Bromodomain-containing protein 8 n=1 Tax=Trametes pubescens TaxID=154538 RepID=A0A1M2V8D5_TRAPU|nr:Bromodomain-containing protein 8 [Trametes pubescens]
MASAVRSRKSTSTPELDVSSLNNVERLIFAQAVHEFGTRAWPEVAKLLSNHPLISQPKDTFTAQVKKHLKLAQRYYVARVKELRELIAAEETKFKKLVTEIDEIRIGAWDDKIRVSVGIASEEPEMEVTEAQHSVVEVDDTAKTVDEPPTLAEPVAAEEVSAEAKEPAPEPEAEQQNTAETEPTPEIEEKREEGSDNEAVDELIGNFTAEKPPDTSQGEELPPAPAKTPEEDHKDDMELDVAEQEEAEATPQPPELPSGEDASQEPESPEVPISMTQEMVYASRSEGKRKASNGDTSMLDAQREHKRPREDSEPADEDDGAPRTRRNQRSGGSDAPVVSKRFQNVIGMLHSQISAHRYGNIFHNPIKKSEAPDYHDIVKRPMDLKTIKSRVKDGLIANSLEFQRDIYLMFANAMMYNRPGSEIYNMAEEMLISSEREINAFRQTEGFHRM